MQLRICRSCGFKSAGRSLEVEPTKFRCGTFFVPQGFAGAAHSSSQGMRFSSACRGAFTGRGCPSLCVQMRPSGDYVVLQSSAPLRYAATPSSDVVLKPNTMTICFNPAGPVSIRARVSCLAGCQPPTYGSNFFLAHF